MFVGQFYKLSAQFYKITLRDIRKIFFRLQYTLELFPNNSFGLGDSHCPHLPSRDEFIWAVTVTSNRLKGNNSFMEWEFNNCPISPMNEFIV